ncbi:MAG: hypothetical protein M3Q47_12800 [Actinomycetota bacterium]|nr:hypothetical protein [Actinomycetota bacterium]
MTRSQRRTGRPTTDDLTADSSRRARAVGRRVMRSTVVGAVMIGIGAVATPASATHSHLIQTPGTCVDKGGAGFGTGEDHASGDGLTFHSQVHKGTPGEVAFEKGNNPVSVAAGTCG